MTLDIRDFKQHGLELSEAILQAVKDTQSVIIRELPNVLKMTTQQFEMLKSSPEMMSTNAKEYLWRTPMNIMEIEVVGK